MASRPFRVGIVDTLIGLPTDPGVVYRAITPQLRDAESLNDMKMPAGYMFKDIPEHASSDDSIAALLSEMDTHGIDVGLISVSLDEELAGQAMVDHPDRFAGAWTIDPNEGMAGIAKLVAAHERWGLSAVAFMPHGTSPAVAIDAPLAYVVYAKCVELGLPIFVTVGIAGPRVPSAPQRVELIDQVMYDFPDLVFVMRHGAEPWVDLAVKLMIKWPNLYYSTSAFAPKYYPAEIIAYANSRGADKILYGGYYPMGLSLERIMTEMREVPLNDDVMDKFLRHNAARILRLDAGKLDTEQKVPS